LFIGGNKACLQDPIYQAFKEGEKHDIEIKGIIYVPKKILVGICFPKANCGNKFPHMTLLLGQKSGFKAFHSNNILEATCDDMTKFKTSYEQMSKKGHY